MNLNLFAVVRGQAEKRLHLKYAYQILYQVLPARDRAGRATEERTVLVKRGPS